ncbi:MAG: hypothetical protein Q6L58_11590 [Thermostichales cyanobacterium BF3_bins_165]
MPRGGFLVWLLGLTLINGVVVAGVLLSGLHTIPQVRGWNWDPHWVTAGERVLFLRFNRVMDPESVAAGWQTDPALPGRWHAQGQTLAYTLTEPVRYDQTYTLTLRSARDQEGYPLGRVWQQQFRTPPRHWVTLSAPQGQLLQVTGQGTTITPLTPGSWQVQEMAAGGPTVAFLTKDGLYTWQRGRIRRRWDQPQSLLQFRLAPDGTLLLADRLHPNQPGVSYLWHLNLQSWFPRWQPLESIAGADFLITPDNSSILISQGQGISLIPLQGSPTDIAFLARYGQALAVKTDGTAAAMVAFQPDYERALWIVTNTGEHLPVFAADGSIRQVLFHPVQPVIYSVVSIRDPQTLAESPVLLAINWETGLMTEIANGTNDQEIQADLAPDGAILLYSLMTHGTAGIPRSPSGQPVSSAQTFWVPIEDNGDPHLPPQDLGIPGAGVKWLY